MCLSTQDTCIEARGCLSAGCGSHGIQGKRQPGGSPKRSDADAACGIKTHCATGQKRFTWKAHHPQEILNGNQQHKASLRCPCSFTQSTETDTETQHGPPPGTLSRGQWFHDRFNGTPGALATGLPVQGSLTRCPCGCEAHARPGHRGGQNRAGTVRRTDVRILLASHLSRSRARVAARYAAVLPGMERKEPGLGVTLRLGRQSLGRDCALPWGTKAACKV